MARTGENGRRGLQLRAALAACVAAAAFGVGAGSGAGRAQAQVMPVPGYGTPLPEGTPAPSAAPTTPAPTASPSPAPNARMLRGGPLTFTLTGALSLGQRLQSNTIDFGGSQSTQSSSQASDSAGMLATLRRRTSTTTLQLGLPIGLDLRQSSIGLLQAGYYTPTYGIEYGAQPLSLLGLAPLGQTLRGWAFVTPLRGGDLTAYTGPALGPNQQTLRVSGVRARVQRSSALLEFGVDRAYALDGSRVDAAVLGAARVSGVLSQSVEAAFEDLSGGSLPQKRTFALQYNAGVGSGPLYATLSVRRIGDGFISFGSGALQADKYLDASVRYGVGQTAIDVESAFETSGSEGGAVGQRRDALTFTHFFRRSGAQTALTFQDDRIDTLGAGTSWTGSAGGQLGFSFAGVSALLGAQFQRGTQNLGPSRSTTTYSGVLQRQFGQYFVGASFQSARAAGTTPGVQNQSEFSLTRTFGPMAFGFQMTQTRNVSGLADIEQTSPTITLMRRLSSVATLGLTYGEQRTRDLLNPLGNGRSRIFNVQVQAPFAFGSGLVQGRVNPRLPATISGTVLMQATQQLGTSPAFLSAVGSVSNGLSNVVVVLDGTQVQRTDLAGHYQFNFVSPGEHQVRVETSSLPRGVTVDQPYAAVTVLGGQAGEVDFQVGTYAAIAGHVYSRNASGDFVPLQGVALRLDDATNATSDPLGAYSFGRLSAGVHTVEIITSSLPAMVAFSASARTQKVTVQNGELQTLDFKASPLGSISGFVKYAPQLAPDHTGGVYNAYVVAQPGDYAAITNEDGSYELDNLPAGTYTIDIDPETIPDGTGNVSGPISVDFSGSEDRQGVNFTLSKKQKQVVFTLQATQTVQASLSLSEPALPPRGAAYAQVEVDAHPSSVTLVAFGKRIPAAYDPKSKRWGATIVVPDGAPSGKNTIGAEIAGLPQGQSTTAAADLNVDPSIPLVSFKLAPAHASIGEFVAVRARFFADVHPGDTIRWLDGQLTKLTHPLTGRVYAFTVKISERPMHGVLLTRQGQLPITLR